MTTDSFVVGPLRFPGGSIGETRRQRHGQRPRRGGAPSRWRSRSRLILEEGLETVTSCATRSRRSPTRAAAGVTGGRRRHEGRRARQGRPMYVDTTGVGVVDDRLRPRPDVGVRPGDQMLVSGPIGDHGIAILLARGDLDIDADIRATPRSLWPLADALIDAPVAVACAACATRLVAASPRSSTRSRSQPRSGSCVDEAAVPVRDVVTGAGEILGIDPLYVANEGRLVAFVAPEAADAALAAMQATPDRYGAVPSSARSPRATRSRAGSHRVRRPPDDRHAGWRPPPAYLLRSIHGRHADQEAAGHRRRRARGGVPPARPSTRDQPGFGRPRRQRLGKCVHRDRGSRR